MSSYYSVHVPISTMQELLSFSASSPVKSMAVSGHTVCVAFQTSLSISVYCQEGAKLRHVSSVDCKNVVMAALGGWYIYQVDNQKIDI